MIFFKENIPLHCEYTCIDSYDSYYISHLLVIILLKTAMSITEKIWKIYLDLKIKIKKKDCLNSTYFCGFIFQCALNAMLGRVWFCNPKSGI